MPENIETTAFAITLREHLESVIQNKFEGLRAIMDAIALRLEDTRERSDTALSSTQAQLKQIELLAVERLEGLRREMLLIQQGADEAITKAERATEKRFESVNEFRLQLGDQSKTFATKDDLVALANIVSRVEKFMYLLMGAFILLNILARYLPQANAMIGLPK